MKRPAMLAAALVAFLLGAPEPSAGAPKPPKPFQSRFTLTISGLVSGSVEGSGPLSSALRRSRIGTNGEVLAVKLRGTSPSLGKLDLDVTPEVTGKAPGAETGRFDLSKLGATGTLTLGRERTYFNAQTGEMVIEETDARHVKGRLDFQGPCKTSVRQGSCTVHAEFDVSRQRGR